MEEMGFADRARAIARIIASAKAREAQRDRTIMGSPGGGHMDHFGGYDTDCDGHADTTDRADYEKQNLVAEAWDAAHGSNHELETTVTLPDGRTAISKGITYKTVTSEEGGDGLYHGWHTYLFSDGHTEEIQIPEPPCQPQYVHLGSLPPKDAAHSAIPAALGKHEFFTDITLQEWKLPPRPHKPGRCEY